MEIHHIICSCKLHWWKWFFSCLQDLPGCHNHISFCVYCIRRKQFVPSTWFTEPHCLSLCCVWDGERGRELESIPYRCTCVCVYYSVTSALLYLVCKELQAQDCAVSGERYVTGGFSYAPRPQGVGCRAPHKTYNTANRIYSYSACIFVPKSIAQDVS